MVANGDQLLKLGWKPEVNDLPTMISHAYEWERKLVIAHSQPFSAAPPAGRFETPLPAFAGQIG